MPKSWYRRGCAISLGFVAFLIATISISFAAPEWGVDRPGRDYKNFNLPSDTPSLCEQACNSEAQCQAWTFVRPGFQGPAARCWLKNAIPAPKTDSCCVSGVKAAPTYQGTFEPNVNRPGKDYKNLGLQAADPQLCRQRCLADGQCRAWTYVKPGVQGPAPRCWLKNDVPLARIDVCCTSGVK